MPLMEDNAVYRPQLHRKGARLGLWKITNGGTTWFPVTDGQVHSSSVGAIAISESNPDVVYIGMGETELRSSIMQGDGVYKTVDAGKTWKHIGLADTQAISRIRVDPTNPDVVYVAALGHPYGPNEERGVFRSKDGGATWKRILFRSNRAGAIDLAMDARNPPVLFAAIWDVYRSPWTLSSGGPGSGMFKSTDNGDTGTEITRNRGLPKTPWRIGGRSQRWFPGRSSGTPRSLSVESSAGGTPPRPKPLALLIPAL
jgi:hypothetical protein